MHCHATSDWPSNLLVPSRHMFRKCSLVIGTVRQDYTRVATHCQMWPDTSGTVSERWYACSWVMLQIKYKNKARLGKPFLLQSRGKVRNVVVTNDNWIQSKCDQMRWCVMKMRKMRWEMKLDKVGRSRMKSEQSNMGRTKSKDEIWGWVVLLFFVFYVHGIL